MWKLLSRHKTKVDQELAQIEAQVQNAIIRHFEGNQNILFKLPFEDYFDLLIEYSDALSVMGKSKKYIAVAEELIHYIFERNISEHKGVDLLQAILFKKALAHYHLHQYNDCEHIMRELLKMDSNNAAYKRIYRQCLYKLSIKGDTFLSRSIFLVLVFAYAVMVGFELFLVNPLYPGIAGTFEIMRWSIFMVALTIFIFGESRHHLMTWLRLKRDVKGFQVSKQQKEKVSEVTKTKEKVKDYF